MDTTADLEATFSRPLKAESLKSNTLRLFIKDIIFTPWVRERKRKINIVF